MDIITIEDHRKMESINTTYLKSRVLLLMSFLFFAACSSKEKYNSEVAVKEFYERAKERESDLDILFNVAFTARGQNDDGTFYIHHLRYKFSESKSIVLPVIETGRSRQDIIKSDDYKNVKEYASMQGITEAQALDYITEVPKLVNALKIGKVSSSPQLGRFIIFNVSDIDEVVYIPDTSKVNHSYWQKFFKTENKFDDHWYYKTTKKDKASD